jgi:hypothetical protein
MDPKRLDRTDLVKQIDREKKDSARLRTAINDMSTSFITPTNLSTTTDKSWIEATRSSRQTKGISSEVSSTAQNNREGHVDEIASFNEVKTVASIEK